MKNKMSNSPIGYEIPQMEDNEVGLRNFDNRFQSSEFVAPIFGHETTDVMTAGKDGVETEVNSTYDSFRTKSDKKVSEDELLRKHGTLYPEFKGVTDDLIRPKQEEKPQITKPVEEKPVSFENITFETPKEDYSSKETTLPPFFFQSKPEPKPEPVYTPPVQETVQTTPIQEFTPPVQPYTPPVQQYTPPVQHTPPVQQVELKDKIRRPYVYPNLSLFDKPVKQDQDDPSFLLENKEIINQTFEEFNIKGEVENYTYGPSVTRYEVKLAPGINVKKVLGIVDTIKMNLGAKTLRVEAPIPGKKHVGIEVPNRKAQMVHYYDIINNEEFKQSKDALLIALGRDIDGNSVYNNIAEMPHGLIAGATASGKSVCINTLLISLLMKNSPDDLRMILVDPKMVELSSYDNIPHLVTPVITEAPLAIAALKWSVNEMERRYEMLKSTGCRNIVEYKDYSKGNLSAEKLPYIVIVIDEFGDLMSNGAGAELDEPIKRLAQKARAAGIHLILATQRPSTDVIRGSIKANIPGRIAFRVAQLVDSQTILDSPGAENLLGKGDMLIKGIDGLMRVQGAYIGGRDIENVTRFIRDNNECDYLFTHEELKKTDQTPSKEASGNSEDLDLLHSAATYFISNGSCSINGLQNKFGIGFNRAQRVVEQLSQMGIVGSKSGTLSREIKVSQSQLDEMFNKNN